MSKSQHEKNIQAKQRFDQEVERQSKKDNNKSNQKKQQPVAAPAKVSKPKPKAQSQPAPSSPLRPVGGPMQKPRNPKQSGKREKRVVPPHLLCQQICATTGVRCTLGISRHTEQFCPRHGGLTKTGTLMRSPRSPIPWPAIHAACVKFIIVEHSLCKCDPRISPCKTMKLMIWLQNLSTCVASRKGSAKSTYPTPAALRKWVEKAPKTMTTEQLIDLASKILREPNVRWLRNLLQDKSDDGQEGEKDEEEEEEHMIADVVDDGLVMRDNGKNKGKEKEDDEEDEEEEEKNEDENEEEAMQEEKEENGNGEGEEEKEEENEAEEQGEGEDVEEQEGPLESSPPNKKRSKKRAQSQEEEDDAEPPKKALVDEEGPQAMDTQAI
jgi:hypothetical protein